MKRTFLTVLSILGLLFVVTHLVDVDLISIALASVDLPSTYLGFDSFDLGVLAETGVLVGTTTNGETTEEPTPAQDDGGTSTTAREVLQALADDPELAARFGIGQNTPVAVVPNTDEAGGRRPSGQRQPTGGPQINVGDRGYHASITRLGLDVTPELYRTHLSMVRLMKGCFARDLSLRQHAVEELRQLNAYMDVEHQRADGFYATLTDGQGGVLIPTLIEQNILRVRDIHGLIRSGSTYLPTPVGKKKWPNMTALLEWFAIGESGEAKVRKASLGSIVLDPDSWGLIVLITQELDDEAGALLMPVLLERIGEAKAKSEDNAGFNGDGTAPYGNITGIISAAGTNWSPGESIILVANLTWQHFVKMKYSVPSIYRAGAGYFFHPDMEMYLELLRDDQNRPLYLPGDGGGGTFAGRPVRYSTILPDPGTPLGTGDTFGVFGNLRYGAFAEKPGMQVKELTEATVLDDDDTTELRLGSRNMKGTRLISYFDYEVAIPAAFATLDLD